MSVGLFYDCVAANGRLEQTHTANPNPLPDMQKLTPESFGATQTSRIRNLLAGHPLPVRVELLIGVQDALDSLIAALVATIEGEADDTAADPTLDQTAEASTLPGAETATAPGEPGTVAPGA